jgi:hypothetical protein
MEWIILEALVVLALGLLIVWWTTRPARRRRPEAAADDGKRSPDQ